MIYSEYDGSLAKSDFAVVAENYGIFDSYECSEDPLPESFYVRACSLNPDSVTIRYAYRGLEGYYEKA